MGESWKRDVEWKHQVIEDYIIPFYAFKKAKLKNTLLKDL